MCNSSYFFLCVMFMGCLKFKHLFSLCLPQTVFQGKLLFLINSMIDPRIIENELVEKYALFCYCAVNKICIYIKKKPHKKSQKN